MPKNLSDHWFMSLDYILVNRESSTKKLSEACGGNLCTGSPWSQLSSGFHTTRGECTAGNCASFSPHPLLPPETHHHRMSTQNVNIGTNSKETIPWSIQKRMMSYGMPMRFGPNQEFSKLCATCTSCPHWVKYLNICILIRYTKNWNVLARVV